MMDLVGYQAQIGAKTKFGRKPGPSEWYHTLAYLATYAPRTNLADVIALFAEVGAPNEVEAARWIALNMKHVP